MDVYVTDDQIGVYFRRRQLGLRLLSHGARPHTVRAWTGLTRDQLTTLRRRWAIAEDDWRPGPSSSSFQIFFETAAAAAFAALFVSLCQLLGVLPSGRGPQAAKRLPSLERGERLCQTFEILKTWDPTSNLTFEQAVLLAVGATDASTIELRTCAGCDRAQLVNRLVPHTSGCTQCPRGARTRGRTSVGRPLTEVAGDETRSAE